MAKKRYIKRFFTPPKQSYFLFGPRGSGKTTWLKKHYKNAVWIDLLEPNELRYYSSYPERLRETIDENPKIKTIVIDEVQKVPELLSVVHAIIEEKRGIQFVLTGSSARKLKRAGANLLAGRAVLCFMYPFLAGELGSQFSLTKALKLGMLPLIWASSQPHKVLHTYDALYLKEEVQQEGLVRNLGDFSRFLQIISFSHGSTLNTTNIAKECSVKRKTVENYISILEDLLLGFKLQPFNRRAKRQTSTHPKFYLFDPGVYKNLRKLGPLDKSEEIEGPGLEGLVAAHLKAWVESQTTTYQLNFWRTRSGLEVDFIVYGPKTFYAIEVKNAKKLSPNDVKGLKAFLKDYPECKPFLLYRGARKTTQGGISCIPVELFLKSMNLKKLI